MTQQFVFDTERQAMGVAYALMELIRLNNTTRSAVKVDADDPWIISSRDDGSIRIETNEQSAFYAVDENGKVTVP
jgi:hypothetical protein